VTANEEAQPELLKNPSQAVAEVAVRTFVATLSVHVDNQQLGNQEEEVYLSLKDGFAFGSIVEITPIQ
jgi:hypothetical protein